MAPTVIKFRRCFRQLRLIPCDDAKVVISFGIVSVLFLVLAAGYLLGMTITQSSALSQWRDEVVEHYYRASTSGQAEIRILASKIGYLEAGLTRMEMLGRRLVEVHDLNSEEFDFTHKPGVGGVVSGSESIHPEYLELSVKHLHSRLDETELQLAVLSDLIGFSTFKREMLPQGWPVSKGWISSEYGYRISPFSGQREFHPGIDIAGQHGSRIHAVASGIIKHSGHYGHYGNFIEIEHSNGYITRYGHNQINLVKMGDAVKQNDVIALMGSSGRSTGPHLHFEMIKQGRRIDPAKGLRRH